MRRDWSGIVLAGFFAVIAVWTATEAVRGSRLWWFATFIAALFATFGLASSAPKARRDDRGRIIKAAASPNGGD
jgi:hypothetical protein